MTNKEQIIIDTNKYFVELTDESRGTIGYTVVFPGDLLEDIIRQNRQLARKTQECEELKKTLNSLTQTVVMPMSEPEVIDLTDRYRKALEEIEGYAKENDEMLQGYHHEWANNKQILEIINKAKGEKDER